LKSAKLFCAYFGRLTERSTQEADGFRFIGWWLNW
jgi:hypothetical protein